MKLLSAFVLLAFALSSLTSCMVTTSAAVVDSCVYVPRVDASKTPEIYRVGDAYYLKLSVRYVCEADKVMIGGVVAVPGSEVRLPIRYHDEYEPQLMYVLMDEDAVKRYVGVKPKKSTADVTSCYTVDTWDASKAELCKQIRSVPKDRIFVHKTSKGEGCFLWEAKDPRYDRVNVYLPTSYSWDAVYKFPLAAVLAVGVDVPCTAVATVGGLTLGSLGAILVAPMQLQQHDMYEEYDENEEYDELEE